MPAQMFPRTSCGAQSKMQRRSWMALVARQKNQEISVMQLAWQI